MKTTKKFQSFFIIIFGLLSFCVNAQPSGKAFDKTIVLSAKNIRMDSLIRILSRQTGFEFSFNSNKISPSKLISVPGHQQTLKQWLSSLKKTFGVDYKLVGNHIILIESGNRPIKTTKEASQKITSNTKKYYDQVGNFNKKTGKMENIQIVSVSSGSASRHRGDTIMQPIETFIPRITYNLNLPVASPKYLGRTELNPLSGTLNVLKTANEDPVKKVRSVRGDPENGYLEPLTKIDLGLQGIGISFERRLGRRSTIDLSGGIGWGYAVTGLNFSYTINPKGPEAYFSVNPRFYINSKKRIEKGKNMEANAGSYLGLRLKYVTEEMIEDRDEVYHPSGWITVNGPVWSVLLFNVHYGIQRPLGNRWLVNGHAGLGFGIASSYFGYNHLYPSLELKFSYRFKKSNQ